MDYNFEDEFDDDIYDPDDEMTEDFDEVFFDDLKLEYGTEINEPCFDEPKVSMLDPRKFREMQRVYTALKMTGMGINSMIGYDIQSAMMSNTTSGYIVLVCKEIEFYSVLIFTKIMTLVDKIHITPLENGDIEILFVFKNLTHKMK